MYMRIIMLCCVLGLTIRKSYGLAQTKIVPLNGMPSTVTQFRIVVMPSRVIILVLKPSCYISNAAGTQQATCPTQAQRELAQRVVTASFSDFMIITDNDGVLP
jgi:hypothetical protein